jgi:hypothetical protein
LLKVEVDLLKGTEVLDIWVVNLHDETTINKQRGNSDTLMFTNEIGVEGYQKSPMNDPKRTRLIFATACWSETSQTSVIPSSPVLSMSAVTL